MNNPLQEYFENNQGRLIHKWMHYFDIYHRHFQHLRGQAFTMVEFGVYHGGSLQMWKNYFGDQVKIIGVDINPACASLNEEQIHIEIGDQEDRKFLQTLRDRYGPLDLIIDDGGHTMGQQIATFEELYPAVSEDGIYLVEDLLTSYRLNFNAGYRRPNTFIEYSKKLIDQLNAYHSQEPDKFAVDDFTRTTYAMHYYDSILVIEKSPKTEPFHKKTGHPSF
jgi:cephalosporin hydroxylase